MFGLGWFSKEVSCFEAIEYSWINFIRVQITHFNINQINWQLISVNLALSHWAWLKYPFNYEKYFQNNNFHRIMPKILFKLEKEIKTIQENQSTEEIYSEQLLKSRDDIKKLENQLEVVQKRCGEAMSENTNLRGSIDHLLLERWVTFIAFLHAKIFYPREMTRNNWILYLPCWIKLSRSSSWVKSSMAHFVGDVCHMKSHFLWCYL